MNQLIWAPDFSSNLAAEPRYWLGLGPFFDATRPYKGHFAFYIQDFFLSEKVPWKHPQKLLNINQKEFLNFLESSGPGLEARFEWKTPTIDPFRDSFYALKDLMNQGWALKGVPLCTEEGEFFGSSMGALKMLFRKNLQGLWPYGFIGSQKSLLGASPEILFKFNGADFSTMALAGTCARGQEAKLLSSSKDLEEHARVVEDLKAKLKGFKRLTLLERRIASLELLSHLMTPIEARCDSDFLSLVNLLHPTAALGVFPANKKTKDWLNVFTSQRGFFGAPFGYLTADQQVGGCLVAIRQIQINSNHAMLSSGCGVVSASNFFMEWDELALKRESVKRLFL